MRDVINRDKVVCKTLINNRSWCASERPEVTLFITRYSKLVI